MTASKRAARVTRKRNVKVTYKGRELVFTNLKWGNGFWDDEYAFVYGSGDLILLQTRTTSSWYRKAGQWLAFCILHPGPDDDSIVDGDLAWSDTPEDALAALEEEANKWAPVLREFARLEVGNAQCTQGDS